eukprot:6164646-Pleurochrysis_carterae.AAC.2
MRSTRQGAVAAVQGKAQYAGLALFSRPALALRRGGDRVVVSRLTVFGLNGVGVVAVHFPVRDWIHMAREDGTVIVERVGSPVS